jgi:hypothetical protein
MKEYYNESSCIEGINYCIDKLRESVENHLFRCDQARRSIFFYLLSYYRYNELGLDKIPLLMDENGHFEYTFENYIFMAKLTLEIVKSPTYNTDELFYSSLVGAWKHIVEKDLENYESFKSKPQSNENSSQEQ